jgi:hypothetical protein
VDQKQELQETLKAVKAARNSHESQQVIKLLDLMYELAKEEMVAVTEENLAVTQAKARTIKHIRNQLAQPTMAESQAPYKREEFKA